MTPRIIRTATTVAISVFAIAHAGAQTPPQASGITAPSFTESSAPIYLAPPSMAVQSDESATPALMPSGDPNERISINWTAMPLSMVIPEVEKLTGRTIIRPATLPNVADLSLSFATPPTRAEALQAIESLFSINQLALVPRTDKFLLLIPLNMVRNEAPTIIEGSTLGLPPSGRIATKLFQLEFLRASEFIQSLGTMLNQQAATISLYERANAILITDSIATLQRIETILKQVDRPASTPVQAKFYSLEYAQASDMVNKLRAMFTGPLQQQLGASTMFNADDRTNQVVVIGDPRQLPFFEDLIKKLDVKADPNTRTEVIPLNNADAQQVTSILTSVISGQTRAAQVTAGGMGMAQRQTFQQQGGQARGGFQGGQTQTRGQSQSQTRGGTQGGRATMQQQAGGGNQGGRGGNQGGQRGGGAQGMQAVGGGGMRFGGSVAPAFATAGGMGSALGVTEGNEFSSFVTVNYDQRTNAVVVAGTVDDIRLIKELIAKLDVVVPQVRIEVVIAEVTLSDQAESGISSLGLQILNGKLVGIRGSAAGNSATIGGGTYDSSGVPTNFASPLQPLSAIIGISSTPRKNNTVIYSRPDITTAHNSQGRIFFGETRPVVTASTVNNNNSNNATTSSVTQQEIGTTITVTPLIGADGTVQLTLQQVISDVTGEVTLDGNQQYIIGKRETNSNIVVKSGEIIVLGGIQKNSSTKTSNRLGPIPIIGDLLGSRKRQQNRTELIFFLRPIVLTNTPADNAPAYERLERMSNKEDVLRLLGKTPAPSAQPAAGKPVEPDEPSHKPSGASTQYQKR